MAGFPGDYLSDAELLNGARKALYDRSHLLSPDATLSALQDLKLWIGQELAFEEGASASFGRVLSELWHAEYLDQLPQLLNRFERLASAYFVRRGSVTAFHGFCNAWREGVLRRVLLFAEEGSDLVDQVETPGDYALLASGSAGRREQTLEEAERYFLVWVGDDPNHYERFAYRVMVILDQLGLMGRDNLTHPGKGVWHGSFAGWRGFVDGGEQSHGEVHRLELLADLRFLCGDEAIGREAVRLARCQLKQSRGGAEIQKQARSVVAAPVALGIMGSIRVEKTGEHPGCLNPERAGLQPLVSAVRLLAAQYDLEPGPTLDRVSALGTLGVLKQAQVEKLVASYHVLAGMKVRREIALEHPYLNPDTLSEGERERLKGALEAVRQLQRLVRWIFLGKDRRRS